MPFTFLPVIVPLLAAAFLAGLGRFFPRWFVDLFVVAVSLSVVIFCGFLLVASSHSLIVYWFGGWLPLHGIALGIAFVVDPFAAGMAELVSVLVLAAFVFSSRYFETQGSLYHVLMLVFLGAMCGFSLTGDLFNLFVFFELMSASAFALCGYKTEEPGPIQGSINFAITNTIAAAVVLTGIGMLYARTGALNMAQVGRMLDGKADSLVVTAFVLIMSGFFVKAALVPFHFWLPDAHAVAPTPVCVLFSGVMVELGLYAVARVYWTVFQGSLSPHEIALRAGLVGLGVFTSLWGGFMCFMQRNLKRLLAFSTISHMGFMVVGFGLLVPTALAGTALYIAGHAFIKGSLFFCAGILLHRFGSVDEFDLRGHGRRLPVTAAIFVVAGLGLAGLPPFGIFWGELLVHASGETLGGPWVEVASLATGLLTAGAVLRFAGRVFAGWGPPEKESASEGPKIQEKRETQPSFRRIPALMLGPAVAVLLLAIVSGSSPVRQLIAPSAIRVTSTKHYAASVLDAAHFPPPAAHPASATGSDQLRSFEIACGAILIAAFALFRERLHLKLSKSAEHKLRNGVGKLRRLQSGRAGDYVAWLTWGIVAFGALFGTLLR